MLHPLNLPQQNPLISTLTKPGVSGVYSSETGNPDARLHRAPTDRSKVDADTKNKNAESFSKTQKNQTDPVQLSSEGRVLAQLIQRDREVRTHEAAHAAVGGPYAGSPSLTYKSGPDGRSYAVSGEVSIDVSPVSGDPQATIEKAQTIRAAALAPSQPSAQDLRVAARAMQMAAQAYAELSSQSKPSSFSDQPDSKSDPQQPRGSIAEADFSGESLVPEPFSPSASVTPARTSLSIRW